MGSKGQYKGDSMRIAGSRKLGILVADAVVAIISLSVQTFWPESQAGLFLLGVVGILQVPVYAYIKGITDEDVAAYAAGVHPRQVEEAAEMADRLKVLLSAVDKRDELRAAMSQAYEDGRVEAGGSPLAYKP